MQNLPPKKDASVATTPIHVDTPIAPVGGDAAPVVGVEAPLAMVEPVEATKKQETVEDVKTTAPAQWIHAEPIANSGHVTIHLPSGTKIEMVITKMADLRIL